MVDAATNLEEEYCPPIDSALFYAILSDFDLSDARGLREARAALDTIKASAIEQESSDFDPSGSSGLRGGEAGEGNSSVESRHDRTEFDKAASYPSSALGTSEEQDSDMTSLSNDIEALALHNGSCDARDSDVTRAATEHMDDLEALDMETKKMLLMEMFPNLSEFTVGGSLKSSKGSWARAMEELLNLVYFEEEEIDGEKAVVARGVDGFLEDEEEGASSRGRKRKGKRRKNGQVSNAGVGSQDGRASSLPATPRPDSPGVSAWRTARSDIEFLSSLTKLSPQTISPLYHRHGASVKATISTLCEEINAKFGSSATSTDPRMEAHALELGQEFPSIATHTVMALIRLTHPSAAAAHELAKALTYEPSNRVAGAKLEIIRRYAPIDLSCDDQVETPKPPSFPGGSASPYSTAALASARQTAFTQAQSAYRKSKSTALMGGAAAYYSQLGRDYTRALQAQSAAEADMLAAAQSTRTSLDLHGVDVKNAVRIAREATTAWWHGLGEARAGGGPSLAGIEGFRIVTGLGRHSEGGRGKLGPAVGGMLVREGWKVEVGSGALVVRGVVKRRG